MIHGSIRSPYRTMSPLGQNGWLGQRLRTLIPISKVTPLYSFFAYLGENFFPVSQAPDIRYSCDLRNEFRIVAIL